MFSGVMSGEKNTEKPYKPAGIILGLNVVNDVARHVYCLKMQENAGVRKSCCEVLRRRGARTENHLDLYFQAYRGFNTHAGCWLICLRFQNAGKELRGFEKRSQGEGGVLTHTLKRFGT